MGVLQLGFALGVSAWLGILPNFEEVIFSTPDSQGYRAVSEWLCGQNDGFNLKLFTLRPFFYPLFLASRVLVVDFLASKHGSKTLSPSGDKILLFCLNRC